MNIRNVLYSLIVVGMLTACAVGSDTERRVLLVDMNSTMFEPVVMKRLTGEPTAVDTAEADVNGVYIFDIDSVNDGFYALWSDTVKLFDIVLCEKATVKICGRRGYEREATTNSLATRLYWKLDSLHVDFESRCDTIVARHDISKREYRDSARVKINDALQNVRRCSDSLLHISGGMLTSVPILMAKYNGQRLYTINNDFELFEKYSQRIAQRYPENTLAQELGHQVDSLVKTVLFARRYKSGNKLPPITLKMTDAEDVTLPVQEVRPYVLFFAEDSTKQAADIWEELTATRPIACKIYAEIPAVMPLKRRYNINVGKLQNTDREILRQLQPVIIVTDKEGTIKKTVFKARLSDLNHVIQNLTIFVPSNNQNMKQKQ